MITTGLVAAGMRRMRTTIARIGRPTRKALV
jgi:hypothetical protein